MAEPAMNQSEYIASLQQQLREKEAEIETLQRMNDTLIGEIDHLDKTLTSQRSEVERLKEELLNFAVNTGGTIGDLEKERDRLQAENAAQEAEIKLLKRKLSGE